jgi:hypothetical protein
VPVGLGVECLPESGGVDQVSVLRVSRDCDSCSVAFTWAKQIP